jgi:MFS family permease
MQHIAVGWLVYRLTNSAFWLGVAGFSAQIPMFVFAPIAGVLADHWNRHRMLFSAQALAMVQALLLTILFYTNTIALWNILPLTLLLGVIHAFDVPARQSFLIQMVEKKEDLGNAIALNSSMFNCARFLGPALAGILIAAFSEGFCFLINTVSFIAILVSLFFMRVAPGKKEKKEKHIWRDLKEGVAYAYRSVPIRALLLLIALLSLLGMPYTVLMPVFTNEILHGGPSTLGFLVATTGAGSLVGALYMASRRGVQGLGEIIAVTSCAFGAGILALSFARTLWLAMVLMFLIGFAIIVTMASCNTILQNLVDDDKRGRVMSLYAMAFLGMMPFGSLTLGSLADALSVPVALMTGGVLCVVGAVLFAFYVPVWSRHVHPIHKGKGILPEVARGIQSATALTSPPED